MKRHYDPRHGLLLASLLLTAGLQVSSGAESEPFTRTAMLKNIAEAVIVPGFQGLARASHNLSVAAASLAEAPSSSVLEEARKAWLTTADAAARLHCWQSGPMLDREYGTAFFYGQILPRRIEAVLASSLTLGGAALEEQGATVKGLFTLEYLLFDRHGDVSTNSALEVLSDSPRRREYVLTLARDLETKSAQLASDWSASSPRSASGKFIDGGEESVQLLVNNLISAIEENYERRLNLVLLLPSPISRQLDRVLRSRSGSSLEEVIVHLESVQRFYQGAKGLGLDDQLEQINPALNKQLRQQFEVSLKAVRALAVPVERALVEKRAALEEAAKEVHALEVLFKVDLASALGVTLTFSTNDGD